MKNRPRLVFSILLSFFTLFAQAQKMDSVYSWADQLLLQEVPFPVVTRLERENHNGLPALNRLTEAYLISLDFNQAEDLLKHGDSLASKSTRQDQAYLSLNWSRYYFEKSKYPESMAKAIASLRLTESGKSPSEQTRLIRIKSVFQLGKTYTWMRRMKEARAQLDEAYAFVKRDSARYPILLAQVSFALGLWSKISADYPAAIQYYKAAIALLENSLHERYYDLGRCYNNLGNVYSEQGDYGKARNHLLKALELKKKHGTDSTSLAITYNNLGKFYTDFGNNYKARDCFEQSISLLNDRNPRARERFPEFLNNYGGLLMESDEREEAENKFRKCLEQLSTEKPTSTKRLAPYLSLAGLLTLKGNLKEAGVLLDKAGMILADSQSTKNNISLWHLRKANWHDMLNETDLSEYHFHQALAFSQSANALLVSEIYQELGLLQSKRKQFRSALASFRISDRMLQESLSPNHPQLCTTYNMIGENYLKLNMPDSAIYFLKLAVEKNVSAQPADRDRGLEAVYPFELVSSFYFLSQAYDHRYQWNKSSADLEKSAEYVDLGLRAIDGRRKSLAMTNDQLTFDQGVSVFFERAMETYYTLQKKTGLDPYLEKVFYISELSKSQSLGQSLRESNLRSFSNVSGTLRREEEKLRKQIQTLDLQSLKEQKFGADANPDLVREYKEESNQATAHYQHLQDSIRQHLPGYYQLKYNKTLVTAEDIRRDLLKGMPQTALLQFSVGDSAIYCLVLTSQGQDFYKVENARELKSRIIIFRNQIKLGLTAELNQNAAWLYDRLLKKAEAMLGSGKAPMRQLIIIPDQILCYLPFEALIRNPGSKKFLVSDYEISYGYSSTLLWQKQMEKEQPKHQFIGLAPDFTASAAPRAKAFRDDNAGVTDRFQFQPLTGNVTEVNAISAGMKKNKFRSDVLEGQQATEASFRKLDLRQYDYIHFATHGFVDMDNPQYSGVAFSRNSNVVNFDDILFTNEVYEMQFDAKLVSLSSCDSGIGKLYRGEGMMGLAQAFLFAGAQNLAVSLWKVDDTATSDLMIDFYKRIPGKSLSTALTSAKRKMANSKKFNHPFYWSSFVLIGL